MPRPSVACWIPPELFPHVERRSVPISLAHAALDRRRRRRRGPFSPRHACGRARAPRDERVVGARGSHSRVRKYRLYKTLLSRAGPGRRESDAMGTLRRDPGYASVAVLTMLIGIGANAAIFTVTDAVLLRPFPFADPDR